MRLRSVIAIGVLLGLTACGNLQWPPSSGPLLSNPPNTASRGIIRQVPRKRTGGMVIVKQGDSLYSLSRRHEVSLRGLIVANNVRPPYNLRPGQRLVLPAPREHVVRAGDTLYDISRAYGVDVSSLARINRIVPPYRILPGQTLRLPDTISPIFAAARPAPRRSPPQASRKPPPQVASRPASRQSPPQASRKSSPQAASRPAPREAGPKPAVKPKSPARQAVRVPPPPRKQGGGFSWPVRGKVLSSFGPKGGGLHNDGINIAAPKGAAVKAAENGVVAYAGNEIRGYGNLLLIRHSGGWITAYAHADKLLVQRGDKVNKGQVIARVGHTGNVVSPQLHFEIRKGKQAVNPIRHLAGANRLNGRKLALGPGLD
ncbi:MAG: LysM peptidoglycan-binding domain-containing M23 family metallopeptidase [Rhodospirillales bacterium]|nr:LysM peptidoglycan-binding domain-containing M23 family metallopeptidase [Rhodospirillales bacterium]